MPLKRTYADHGDACATAHALELVGDRWNYPVMRELMLAPKRFGELSTSVRGITPSVLTKRLRELDEAGLVRKVELPAPARVDAYELTPWARELEPILQQLGRWAQASPTRSTHDTGLTPDAAIQAMRTMAPHRAVRPPIELQLHLVDARVDGDPGYDYRLSWSGHHFEVERGTNVDATTTVRADSTIWAGALLDPATTSLAQISIDGDAGPVERLVEQFS